MVRQLVRSVIECTTDSPLERLSHGTVEAPGTGEADLGVEDFLDERVGEAINDVAPLGRFLHEPLRPKLVNAA